MSESGQKRPPPPASPDRTEDARLSAAGAGATGSEPNRPAPPGPGPAATPDEAAGRYRPLRRHAAGGLGEVFLAEDEELHRLVALKRIRGPRADDPESRRRFLLEAEVTGRLEHPGIVPVYGLVHDEEGRPCYAMRFIEGESLKEAVERFHAAGRPRPASARRLELRQLLGRFVAVCNALAYAHSRGVLHRDLKPANVLLGKFGETLVVDWGLARPFARTEAERTGGEETLAPSSASGPDSSSTQMGQALGTPAYMSPEQAAGRLDQVGPASDVYGLGTTLYAVLTGRPPFQGPNTPAILQKVQRGDFPPPRRVNPEVPPGLEAVCLKAMSLEPADRYARALDLAADVEHWLADEPVSCHRERLPARLGRWLRRHRALAAAAAVLLLTALAALTASNVLIGLEQAETERQRQAAVAAEADKELQRRDAEGARRAAELALGDMHTATGLLADERGEAADAVLWFARAALLARRDEGRAADNRLRAAAWLRRVYRPVAALPHEGWGSGFFFQPGGRHLLTLGRAGLCRLWQVGRDGPLPLPGGERPIAAAAWGPDPGGAGGSLLALAPRAGGLYLYRFPGGKLYAEVPHPEAVTALAFGPGGDYLALAGRRARVWDCRRKTFVTRELIHPNTVLHLTFNGRASRLATDCRDGRARVFRVSYQTDQPLFRPVPHQGWHPTFGIPDEVRAPLFLDGDRGLLTLDASGQAVWRSAETGDVLHPVAWQDAGPARNARNGRELTGLAVTPDGSYFAVAGPDGAQFWSAAAGGPVGPVLPHRNSVWSLAFRPDGRALVTTSLDGTARLWSVPDGRPLGHPLPHQAMVASGGFSPDGHLVATVQWDGLLRVWAEPRGVAGDRRLPLNGKGSRVAFDPTGKYLLATGISFLAADLRSVRVYEAESGRPAGPVLRPGGVVLGAALSPRGRHVGLIETPAAGAARHGLMFRPFGQAGRLHLLDWRTEKAAWQPRLMPSEPRSLAFSPDGRRLAVLCAAGELLLFDADTGRLARRLRHPFQRGRSTQDAAQSVMNGGVRFSPDGRSLVTWGLSLADRAVQVWDVEKGAPRYGALALAGMCHDVQFSADGGLLATADYGNTARVWDVATGRPAAAPLPHPDWVFTARFSPDGTRLLTACRDGSARLWDWRAGGPALRALPHAHEVFDVAFLPDGKRAATASQDGTARVWALATGRPLTPALPLGGMALGMASAPTAAGPRSPGSPMPSTSSTCAPGWGRRTSGRRT
jgi:WD40 repeat protein/tRNA A-37 threonylcarbamoyl transferase component Bud32